MLLFYFVTGYHKMICLNVLRLVMNFMVCIFIVFPTGHKIKRGKQQLIPTSLNVFSNEYIRFT